MTRRADPSGAPAPIVIEGVTVLERIGSGGFSVVYRGHEAAMHRDVAVKVLNSGVTTDAERRTFERECRALGQLSAHPNIVTVYRPAFTTDLRPCIVMELYHGNYRDRLDRTGPLPVDELLRVGVRIAGALHTAHQAGVLHRDLKPHNIFLSAYGEPALGDFGISTIDDERSHSAASGLSVAYAAPEVLEDSTATAAADVYSLAATLYHLAAGSAPFSSGDLRTTIRRILAEPPPPLTRPDLPPGLDEALRAAMGKELADRPRSALAFAESLRAVQLRAGLPPTTIPTAASGLAGPLASRTSVGRNRSDGPGDTVSVVPRQPPAAAPPVTPPAAPAATGLSRRRRGLAVAAAVAAAASLAGGIALVGRSGDDGEPPATTAATVPPPDTFYDALATPTAIAVTAAEAGFTVELQPVEGATAYEIVPVNGAADPVTVAADDLPAIVTAPDTAQLCVVVRAVGEGGRISRDSAPVCSG